MNFANTAAAVAVGKSYTSVVTLKEIDEFRG
jgi:bifunctional ADP-heptose synthase (sugar kinase/adenylyltransferase)